MRQQNADSQLIGRMQAGDGTSVADLASTFGPRIHQLALRYVKNWEDAEEVTQDVLMKVFRKIDAFRGDAALSSWIYRITFNTAMSRLRSTRASRMTEMQKPDLSSQEPERTPSEPADWSSLADDHVLRAEMRERLIESLTLLPERLPRAGDPARHSGALDRGGERGTEGEAADAEVAVASRTADAARASRGLCGRRDAARPRNLEGRKPEV